MASGSDFTQPPRSGTGWEVMSSSCRASSSAGTPYPRAVESTRLIASASALMSLPHFPRLVKISRGPAASSVIEM